MIKFFTLLMVFFSSLLMACPTCDLAMDFINLNIYNTSNELYYTNKNSEEYLYRQGRVDILVDLREMFLTRK